MESLFLASMNISYQFGLNTIQRTTPLPTEISVYPLKNDLLTHNNLEIEYRCDNDCQPIIPDFAMPDCFGESPFLSFNFISDDYKYDDDFEYDDFDDDFDEDFEPLPDDDLEDFPDPYSEDETDNDVSPDEEIEIDPFEEFDDLDADENTFVNDDDEDDVEDI